MMESQTTQSGWEVFNLWVFRFLVGVLPYVTPLPLAVMTADSAAKFLNLNIYVAAILVFGLEGIGLLCTSLAVDAVVEWVRSRSLKGVAPVVLFIGILIAYVNILITLNVTLEQADGNMNPNLSQVITLLCYLPLISGVINGWNKLRVETRTKQELDALREEQKQELHRKQQIDVTERDRDQQRQTELEKLRIIEAQKTERARVKAEALLQQAQQPAYQQTTQTPAPQMQMVASQFKDDILSALNDVHRDLGKVLTVKQIAENFQLDYEKNKGYISTLRKKWAIDNNVVLPSKKQNV